MPRIDQTMTNHLVNKVLLVGGGIAGLSASIALARRGIEVHLIDRNPEWGALGAGLTFNGATARAFQQLGVLARVLDAGSGHGSSRVCDWQGRILVNSDPNAKFGAGLPAWGGVLRPVLHEILKSTALELGVSAMTGVKLASVDERPNRIEAVLSNGDQDSFDLVIAADGLSSDTRRMIFPALPTPQFTGQVCWRAIAPRPTEVVCGEVYLGGPHKVGINPISRDLMYMFALVHEPDNPRVEPAEWLSRLREVLTGYGGHISGIRENLNEESSINYRPLESLLLGPPWHKGRIVLIGDAVHATTPHAGYGAGLAIEDGIVLAEELAGAPSLDAALGAFAARRYPRCAAVVNGSLEIGKLEMAGASVDKQRQLLTDIYEEIRVPI
jgi:2-polyprenyl-6-methoxyphenol hydroxylase-like FAD-dependent oxidoreductase